MKQVGRHNLPPFPSASDLKRVEGLCSLLDFFHVATKQLEGDHVTLPLVPSVLAKDAEMDTDRLMVSKLATQFLHFFKKRFGYVFSECNLALQAAALHPSFGSLSWISLDLRNAVWKSLCELGNSLILKGDGSMLNLGTKPFLKALRAEFEQKPGVEISDPLSWWRSQSQLVTLYPLLQYLWGIPASFASAERLFSFLGHLLHRAPQRSPATLEQLALLRDYQKQPGYDFNALIAATLKEKELVLAEKEKAPSSFSFLP